MRVRSVCVWGVRVRIVCVRSVTMYRAIEIGIIYSILRTPLLTCLSWTVIVIGTTASTIVINDTISTVLTPAINIKIARVPLVKWSVVMCWWRWCWKVNLRKTKYAWKYQQKTVSVHARSVLL